MCAANQFVELLPVLRQSIREQDDICGIGFQSLPGFIAITILLPRPTKTQERTGRCEIWRTSFGVIYRLARLLT
jgi:hypothetical protein